MSAQTIYIINVVSAIRDKDGFCRHKSWVSVCTRTATLIYTSVRSLLGKEIRFIKN